MSIAKTFGTLSLTAMGLLNAADATAQDTKTASKPEPDKVVKFITNENNGNEATLVSKSTNAELAGRARVEAANSKPIEFTEVELKEERKKIYSDFISVVPEKLREDFISRADRPLTDDNPTDSGLNNKSLKNLLKGISILEEVGLLTPENKNKLLMNVDLKNSAVIASNFAYDKKFGYNGKPISDDLLLLKLNQNLSNIKIVEGNSDSKSSSMFAAKE